MTVFLYFGFLYVFFGIIVAVLYMLKSSPSKKKKIKKKKVEAEAEVEKENTEKENIIYKGFSLIPDSVFGVGVYILIIFLCIWLLGDSGGECGVDYAPRFFGEC